MVNPNSSKIRVSIKIKPNKSGKKIKRDKKVDTHALTRCHMRLIYLPRASTHASTSCIRGGYANSFRDTWYALISVFGTHVLG